MAAGLLGGASVSAAGCSDDEPDSETSNPVDGGPEGYVVRDGGGEPAQPMEGASLCPAGDCNYQTGEGCTAAAPSCVAALDPMGQAAPICVAPVGSGQSGDACDAHEDCAAGYMCTEQQCHKLCCGGDWSACPSEGEHCIQRLSLGDGNGGAVETGAMLCYPVNTCDALDPGSCTTEGTSCQIVDPSGATACFPEGSGGDGEACPCKGGFLCADLGDEKRCRQLCKAVEGGGEPFCKEGEACVHYNSKHPADVGECVPLE
jgi:hypothetical protein